MKKVLFVFILLVGCMPEAIEMNRTTFYNGFDLRPYLEKQFYITPLILDTDYEILAIMECAVYPETKVKKGYNTTKLNYENLSPMEALDSMYVKAKEMGANGIMNFKIEKKEYNNGGDLVPYYELFGYAIRRK
ncbi:MAG: hypothetical protein JEY94_10725 [Melioribacteraceae bacterium]|nr:hypothetical protein [Melioribacteraceae bacterium]